MGQRLQVLGLNWCLACSVDNKSHIHGLTDLKHVMNVEKHGTNIDNAWWKPKLFS